MAWTKDISPLHSKTPLPQDRFGARAARLSALACGGSPVPKGVALSFDAVSRLEDADLVDAISKVLAGLAPVVLRASPGEAHWGGPSAVLDVSDPAEVIDTLRAMAQTWSTATAKILRQANGAPEDAGLALIVQRKVEGGPARQVQGIDVASGVTLHQGIDKATKSQLLEAAKFLGDVAAFEMIGDQIVDVMPAQRVSRAEIQVVVDLVHAGILTREEAVLKIDPRALVEQLHPQIAPNGDVDIVCRGIGGSPGAAQGEIVFTALAAQAAHSQGRQAILVRSETTPEDIRGMHSAAGVLTSTGGTSSHAAVIAQGIGVPCVVGASEVKIDADAKTLTLCDGSLLSEGDPLTLDGTQGLVMRGALKLTHSPLSEAFKTLMAWADDIRQIGVRANADTRHEAETAKRFLVDGIGLCRTEHMFYEDDRIIVMREMILAEDLATRQAALKKLLPMQRDNFVELFELMEGAPVTIRLLDPPLHEFLPKEQEDIADLAAAMALPEDVVRARIEGMQEFNPMLGKRGVRLAVTMPEIYDMQARAIFEAATLAREKTGHVIEPEIMIPLVSADKEVQLVRARIEAIATEVLEETGTRPVFHLGIMVETPRAALRAGDLARSSTFLSFGTNDLTQMTFGLSRDDAGRFMREYVNRGVYAEDPFLTLDVEAVGELILTAVNRGRATNPNITIGLCGEHGGDPASVRFCQVAGFDYVSCSPYRVPIARLAAAQATLLTATSAGAEGYPRSA